MLATIAIINLECRIGCNSKEFAIENYRFIGVPPVEQDYAEEIMKLIKAGKNTKNK